MPHTSNWHHLHLAPKPFPSIIPPTPPYPVSPLSWFTLTPAPAVLPRRPAVVALAEFPPRAEFTLSVCRAEVPPRAEFTLGAARAEFTGLVAWVVEALLASWESVILKRQRETNKQNP